MTLLSTTSHELATRPVRRDEERRFVLDRQYVRLADPGSWDAGSAERLLPESFRHAASLPLVAALSALVHAAEEEPDGIGGLARELVAGS